MQSRVIRLKIFNRTKCIFRKGLKIWEYITGKYLRFNVIFWGNKLKISHLNYSPRAKMIMSILMR